MKKLFVLSLLFCVHLSFAQGKHSGIIGESLIFSCPVSGPGIECIVHPYPTTIAIYSEKGRKSRLVETVNTDENGLFAVNLKPGVYTLVPAGPPQPPPPPPGIPPIQLIYPYAAPMTVRVEFKEFTPVTIAYDSGAR